MVQSIQDISQTRDIITFFPVLFWTLCLVKGAPRAAFKKGSGKWSRNLLLLQNYSSSYIWADFHFLALQLLPLTSPSYHYSPLPWVSFFISFLSSSLSLNPHLEVLLVLLKCITFHCVILNSFVLAYFPSVSKSLCSLVHSWNLSAASLLSWCHLCLDTQQLDPTSVSFI